MDPKGKVALVTGGARIGQVVAHSLAARGCDLALVYRGSREAAEASAKAAINAGVRAITIRADATDEDQIAAAVKETHRALGRIDILLNMASIYLSTPDPKEADWSNTIDANARSVFLFSTAAAPIMKQSGAARIISFADWLPVSGRPGYLCALLFIKSRRCRPDRKSRAGTGSRNSGQCDRARADPCASGSDSRGEHRGHESYTASAMGRCCGNRQNGALPS